MQLRILVSIAAISAACIVGATPASASAPGPALTVPQPVLDAALTCNEPLQGVTRDPVLLASAFATEQDSFGWNYLRTLPAQGIPVCSLSLPDGGYGDLQVYSQYVVNAVRSMSTQSGRKVALMGHQHGSLYEMWALKFWPDLPAMVSDFISLATPYHGTDVARNVCNAAQTCPPATWQIATGSQFLAAMNAKPLPIGPSYTSIFTMLDELVTPQPRASTLDGGTSIAVQDICPSRPVEHFSILADNVAFQLALDALSHDGPADRTRISPSVCGDLFTPGADLVPGSLNAGADTLGGAEFFGPSRSVHAEPAVESYAR